MTGTLADRIRAERQRQFVGRREELQLFEDVLTAPELPIVVLSIHGPGGVGKTTLLRQLEACSDRLGVHRVTLDTRVIQPNPEAFLGML
jgi:ABC-type transport system involved in cytochrome c biogenesis ATPase subunit